MKLFHKLTIALVFGITLVMAGNALFQVRREAELFDADSSHDQHTVGRVLRASVEAVWRADGEQAARRLIADANESNTDLTLRWVSLEPDPAPADAPEVPRERLPSVLAGRESVVRGRLPSGDDRRITYIPVAVDGIRRGALEVSESLSRSAISCGRPSSRSWRRRRSWCCCAPASRSVSASGSWAGRCRRCATRRAASARGTSRVRSSLRQRDEIGELAGEINAMCARLATTPSSSGPPTEARIAALEQLRHADRLTTVGKLASGVAHELGTPLNVVSGAGEDDRRRARWRATTSRRTPASSSSRRQRIAAIIRQLLDFSRRRGPRARPARSAADRRAHRRAARAPGPQDDASRSISRPPRDR